MNEKNIFRTAFNGLGQISCWKFMSFKERSVSLVFLSGFGDELRLSFPRLSLNLSLPENNSLEKHRIQLLSATGLLWCVMPVNRSLSPDCHMRFPCCLSAHNAKLSFDRDKRHKILAAAITRCNNFRNRIKNEYSSQIP